MASVFPQVKFNLVDKLLMNASPIARCTPRVCIYFLLCSSYDNLSLKIASPNRTHELGHRLGQSMTCMQVHWRMGEEERAGLGRVGKGLEEDGVVRRGPTLTEISGNYQFSS